MFFFFKQKTAYEMRISDWSSDVCSSDLLDMHDSIRKSAPYVFFGQTTSLCESCLQLVPAKILIEGGHVYYQKRCPSHGVQKTLVSTDAAYFQLAKTFLKPGDRPRQYYGRTDFGCPYDCGLCPDQEQHSRSEEHTAELQSLMRISYAVFCLKKK